MTVRAFRMMAMYSIIPILNYTRHAYSLIITYYICNILNIELSAYCKVVNKIIRHKFFYIFWWDWGVNSGFVHAE
jgi:hypothetical protein